MTAQGDNGIPDNDVVLTTRSRLARNLADHPFLNRASDMQSALVMQTAQRVMLEAPLSEKTLWMDLDELERTWKDLRGPERTGKDLKGPERT